MLEVLGGDELGIGMTVARRYRLSRVVGEGGMGIVWAARDLQGSDVALKFLKHESHGDGRSGRRLLREASVMARFAHPNIATVHGVFETEAGTPFLVMDLLHGEPLSARLAREGAPPPALVAQWMRQIIAAIRRAHELGVVHRDLKPENVFLTEGPPETCVRVLDFGIAKAALEAGTSDHEGPSLTTTGAMLGTPYYMAPEQIFGDSDIDPRADVWALGIMIYECLAGGRPTQAKGIGQVMKIIVNGAIPPLEQQRNVPTPVSDVVRRMLSRDRNARPALSEVVAMLDLIEQMPAKESAPQGVFTKEASAPTLDSVEVSVPSAPRTSGPAEVQRNAGRLRLLLTLGGALVVGAAMIASPLARGERPASPPARGPETNVGASDVQVAFSVPTAAPVLAPASALELVPAKQPAVHGAAGPQPGRRTVPSVRAAASTLATESESPAPAASPSSTPSNHGIPSFERR